jgi:beta-glucanase (GH16 family)
MRQIQRINKFFNNHIIDKLHDDGIVNDTEYVEFCQRYDEIKEYWNKYPDQRFFQMLINLNVCENDERWFREDLDILVHYINSEFDKYKEERINNVKKDIPNF